jgi:predicted dehydrogenase
MSVKKRYVQVGCGGRSGMFTRAICRDYGDTCEIVGLCDVNAGRMRVKNKQIEEFGGKPAPMYSAAEFDRMVRETRPDHVIVTTGPDASHSDYIVRAMELGVDAITEKPMTIDEHRCRKILKTIAATGRKVQVTFNYRYSPHRSQLKEMLDGGAIGEVYSIDFTWPLDTKHGADYFRRWHRKLDNSGSLLVHKATHHFDLVNWWIGDVPEEVFCHASRRYYTPATADRFGLSNRSERCLDCPCKGACRFYLDLAGNTQLKEMYLDNEAEDGYFRDRCVFSSEIDIWDNMSVSVRYRRGAILNYLLFAYSPWEGYQIAFNGSRGRLEHNCMEDSYISGATAAEPGAVKRKETTITLVPEFDAPRPIAVRTSAGGHGGGDGPLLADVLSVNPPADPLKRRANHVDGTYSIMIGIAAYRSAQLGRPVKVAELIGDAPL